MSDQQPHPGGPEEPMAGTEPPYAPPTAQQPHPQQFAQPPFPQQQYTPGYATTPPMNPADERTWGCAAHWSAIVGAFVAMAFLGPLLVMLTKGNESAYVRRQAVESLNFQLSMLIYGAVSFVLVFVLIGFVLLPIVGVLWLVFTVLGTVRSSNGEEYRYPLTIRMVR